MNMAVFLGGGAGSSTWNESPGLSSTGVNTVPSVEYWWNMLRLQPCSPWSSAQPEKLHGPCARPPASAARRVSNSSTEFTIRNIGQGGSVMRSYMRMKMLPWAVQSSVGLKVVKMSEKYFAQDS